MPSRPQPYLFCRGGGWWKGRGGAEGGLLEVIPIMQLLPDSKVWHHSPSASCCTSLTSCPASTLTYMHFYVWLYHERCFESSVTPAPPRGKRENKSIWLSLPSHLSGLVTENASSGYTWKPSFCWLNHLKLFCCLKISSICPILPRTTNLNRQMN